MATKTFTQLTAVTTLASGDEVVQWNASAGAARKITVANFIANSPNGGLAELGAANVFTANQRVNALVGIGDAPTTGQQLRVLAGSTTTIGTVVNTPAGFAVAASEWRYNGTTAARVDVRSDRAIMGLTARDFGNNVNGARLESQRNSNAGAEGPAAGTLNLVSATAANGFVWQDAAGNLRIHSTAPTGSSGTPTTADTAGTVIGTQTSMAAEKLLEAADGTPLESLAAVMEAARSGLRAWRYKSGSFNNERFPVGLVTDLAPRYGMDRDAAHPAGKSLNIPVAIGDLFRAVAYLAEQIGVEVENG